MDNTNNDEQIKKDIQRGLKEFFTSAGYIYSSKFMGYDSEIKEVLDTYKSEYFKYFTDDASVYGEPMKTVSQEHWYYLYLEKKRLEQNNVKVNYAEYKHISPNPLEAPQTSYLYRPDGDHLVCVASEYTSIKKNYLRNNQVIGYDNQKCMLDYHILRAHNVDGLFTCPHCGAKQPRHTLIDGCDHCDAKIDFEAYADKVTSVVKMTHRLENRTANEANLSPASLILAIFGCLLFFFGLLLATVTFGLTLPIAAGGAALIYASIKTAVNDNKNVPQGASIKYRLYDNNPGFSEEEFIGSLDCKLKSIHYASTADELGAFVKCDIAPYIKNYQNIVNCETGKIAYKRYDIKGDYQYLELHREIKVMLDKGNEIKPAKGVVKMMLAKKVAHQPKNEATLYRCKCCGVTLSLLEGGKCKYCDTEMDFAAYDWIVVGYEHTKSLTG